MSTRDDDTEPTVGKGKGKLQDDATQPIVAKEPAEASILSLFPNQKPPSAETSFTPQTFSTNASPPRSPSIAPSTVASTLISYDEDNDENIPGTPLTVNSSFIEPDDLSDEGFAESTSSSFVSSIASNIRRGIIENGRRYAAYGQNKPWVPIDDSEMDRNDLQHCKFTLLMGNQLHLSPIHPHPQRILDLGTGSGIWAIDMAEKYPGAEVIGMDTAVVQPTDVPPNCVFEIDDVENEWLYQPDSFDFIHARELVMAVRNWPRLFSQALNALKPGGYFQISGSYPVFTSDDGSLPPGTAYVEVGDIFFQMGDRIGVSGKDPAKWKSQLLEAGFTDVVEQVLKIPTNPWPKDPRMKQIGAFELVHFRDGISNIFARGYTQILGGDPNYFQVLMAKARNEVLNRRMHSYLSFYVVWGKKREEASSK